MSKDSLNPEIIKCETKIYSIGNWTILHLPKEASLKLPSRAQVLIEGTLNDYPIKQVLEPDGFGGHWFKVDKELIENAKVKKGDIVTLTFFSSNDWPNPEIPADFEKAIVANKPIHLFWNDITPMAKWDWIRWIRATKNEDTRAKRIEVALSKMKKGMRRPCCFNRNACTFPEVSKNGQLLTVIQ